MAGLFVWKHAQAVSRFCDVKVLYVHADENIKEFEVICKNDNGIEEIYVYYPFRKDKVFHKIRKTINYFRAYRKGFKFLKNHNWKPEIIHVNILTRTAFIAYLQKTFNKIPYVITEHWSRYFPQNKTYKGWLRKRVTEFVVKRAEVLMPVSNYLKNAMSDYNLSNKHTVIINNVVDDFFFEHSDKKEQRTKKRILHISCFDERAKNICGLLNATKLLSDIRTDFELVIVGTGKDFEKCYRHYESLNFPKDAVKFIGEITPREVSHYLQNSDFSMMFSNYENAPVVISESLAAGVPVICTNVGGIPEMVNASNGILVDVGNEMELSEKMDFMLDNFGKYDSEKIRKEAEKYSFQNVGEKIFKIYKQICHENQE